MLSISLTLLFRKDQTQRGNSNNATERKSKDVNVDGVNYDAKMDRSKMSFTSSVSLPEDSISIYSLIIYLEIYIQNISLVLSCEPQLML